MLNQNFTAEQFSYLARQIDYWVYFKSTSSLLSKKLKGAILNDIEVGLKPEQYQFSALSKFKIGKNDIYTLPKIDSAGTNKQKIISDDFILRKINQNLIRIYKVSQADRFQIITNVKSLLYQTLPFYVYKIDIKSFYESINRDKIVHDIEKSALVSFETKILLKKFFEVLPIECSGLPRGISISAVLSEYYMKYFDTYMRMKQNFFYYARFVDDIIIFSTERISSDEMKEIENSLPSGLSFNQLKYEEHDLTFRSNRAGKLTYLGYEFNYNITKEGKKSISTRIALKKINKIKSRIVSCFVDNKRNKNIKLLRDRLKFLSTTYPLKTQRQRLSKFENAGYLHGGILYSYPLIDDLSCLKEIDTFLHQVILSKSFGRLSASLSNQEKESLKKYSFVEGYKRRISRKFSLDYIQQIIKCWK